MFTANNKRRDDHATRLTLVKHRISLDPRVTSGFLKVNIATSEVNGLFMAFSTARRGLFVGYDEHRRAYMVLPDGGAQAVLSRSVVFDERVVVQRILGFCARGKDNSYSLDRDKEVSGSIHHVNGQIYYYFVHTWHA